MKIEDIGRFVKRTPFRPFSLRESSGETHRVLSPEMILLAPTVGTVVVQTPDDLLLLAPEQITAAFYTRAGKPAKGD